MNIAIIGAGVSGLSCGVRLLERGHRVSIIAERRTPDTTSDRSAAAFTPFRAPSSDRLRRWTARSYATFQSLARERVAECGVRVLPMTELFFERLDEVPWWFDLVEGAQRVEHPPARFADGIRARMPTMDMTRYMPWLERRAIELGATMRDARVESLREPFARGFELVVDASGLGARELAQDKAMTPMRGQIVHAPNDIALDECFADSGHGSDTTYVFPFERHIVLGGTYERGVESATTDADALDRIVERCRMLLRDVGQPRANDLARTRLRSFAGLRPARTVDEDDEAIRLELEMLDGELPVVHDYGHGRIGVTVSWGCADEVVEIVEKMR
jgi:D-amino-acid oxidase